MSAAVRRSSLLVALLLALAVLPAPVGAAGERIVYARDVAGGFDLFSTRPDGGGVRRLTRNGEASAPVWSPDKRWIAYARFADDQADIFISRADGSDRRRLTRTGEVIEIPTS